MHKIYSNLKGFCFSGFSSYGFIPYTDGDRIQIDILSGDGYAPNNWCCQIGFGRGGYPSGDGGLVDFMIWFEETNA